jgi:hypothetical protein
MVGVTVRDGITGKRGVRALEADTRQRPQRVEVAPGLGSLAVGSHDGRAGWWPGKPR